MNMKPKWHRTATADEIKEDGRLKALIGLAWADIHLYTKARKLISNRCIKRAAYRRKHKR